MKPSRAFSSLLLATVGAFACAPTETIIRGERRTSTSAAEDLCHPLITASGAWAVVEFAISEAGDVEHPRVIDSNPASGPHRAAAVEAVSRWRFQPEITHGSTRKLRQSPSRVRIDFGESCGEILPLPALNKSP